ncbi:MAG: hypothetical protein AAFQ62_15990 [Pseudomonadota bacterium]
MLQKFIVTYSHDHRIGVLVEIHTIDDFTFEIAEVQEFVTAVRLHIASQAPKDVEELLSQPFVIDTSMTVGERLSSLRQYLKSPLKVARFVRWDSEMTPPAERDDGPGPAPPYSSQLKVVS